MAGAPSWGNLGTKQAFTPTLWVEDVLVRANLPTTKTNINDLLHWITLENHPATWWIRGNPLNATLGAKPTATPAGIVAPGYPTLTKGATETAKMLKQSNMKSIFAGLNSGKEGLKAFGASVIASPWASSHYGNDPTKFVTSALPTGNAPASEGGLTGLQILQTFGGFTPKLTAQPKTAGGVVPTNLTPGGLVTRAFKGSTTFFGKLLGEGMLVRGTLIVVGILLLLIGVNRMLSGGKDSNPVSVVVEGGKDVGKKAGNVAKAGGEAVAA